MSKKKLPIGVSDFKEIIEDNYYYVDKTNFVAEILEKRAKATLITRPRRFGKTLSMTTLKYFLDIKNGEENRKLFQGLNIERTEHMEEQGKYPVIYLTLKDCEGKTYSAFLDKFKSLLSKLFSDYEYLMEKLNAREFKEFNKIWLEEKDGKYDEALNFLANILYKYTGLKPVILIDEYDAPMIKANEHGYYDEIKDFIGGFYGSALKDGVAAFSVITGILRVAKESIFSTLNNLEVSTILDKDYEWFGMEEWEVEEILKYYDLETTLEDTKIWYNGYLFGTKRVYNPWSILSHCRLGELKCYWINTSANTLIMEMLRDADNSIVDIFHGLLKGDRVKTILNDHMIFNQKYSNSAVLYLMFSGGYLTIDKLGEVRKEYYLRIPNYEVKEYFKDTFLDIVKGNEINSFSQLEDALVLGKVRGVRSIEESIQDMFTSSLSYHDGAKEEKFYHNLVLGMLIGLDRDFYVLSNREEGLGRYDLALEPKDKNGYGYIFEFKVAKSSSEEDMDLAGEAALDQIDKKIYETGMRDRGIKKIVKLGMVFSGKSLRFYER
ncbi:AAA family ATPase (plasmid) [Cetobacterium somerae]|uniref:AAA family ATPase n=1 Tax=Cetobacterium somerae TaxID=188913 RepID=UPI003D769AC0